MTSATSMSSTPPARLSSAVNPSLTIIANAIRIAEHLLAERFK
jgi:hypothetical protein